MVAAGFMFLMPVTECLYSTAGCRAVTDFLSKAAACAAGYTLSLHDALPISGASRTVQFVGQVTVASLADGSLIHATARVGYVADTADLPGLATTVHRTAPLVLTLDEDRDPVGFGDTLKYVLRFGNRSAAPLL